MADFIKVLIETFLQGLAIGVATFCVLGVLLIMPTSLGAPIPFWAICKWGSIVAFGLGWAYTLCNEYSPG